MLQKNDQIVSQFIKNLLIILILKYVRELPRGVISNSVLLNHREMHLRNSFNGWVRC